MKFLPGLNLSWVLWLACIPCTQAQTVNYDTNITFTTIDVPGAGVTSVRSINVLGDMVGLYADSNNGNPHAFLLHETSFDFLDYPGAEFTVASGINDGGQITGYAGLDGGLIERGFLYDGQSFSPVRVHGQQVTVALGINDPGVIVGGSGSPYTTRGFEFRNGLFRAISPPGSYVYIYATSINRLGAVVGWTDHAGFLLRHGNYKTIQFPGADVTQAWGINDDGTIVGWYAMGGAAYAFAVVKGQYLSFGYPGATGTFSRGINASGQIVGEYTFDFITYHGFVTSPIAFP